MQKEFDLIIIGAGPAGYEAAIRAAQLGLQTALVEGRQLGGTCLNRGCIPTKTIMHSTHMFRQAVQFAQLGIKAEQLDFDMQLIQDHKDQVVRKLQDGIGQLMKANKIAVHYGQGKLLANHQVQITPNDGEPAYCLEAPHILIATGAQPAKPPIKGSTLPGVWTSDDLLDSTAAHQVYDPLIIIGGGVIGVEMASIYSDLGCKVTIIEALPRILATFDREVSQNLNMVLKKRGVEIHTNAMVTEIAALSEPSDGLALRCDFTAKGEQKSVLAAGILLAVGRKPQTTDLFDPEAMPAMERGYITVDQDFQTSLPGVYAVGDVIGGIQLAHVAAAEGINAVEIIAGMKQTTNFQAIPGCVYTSPEIAGVGLTEEEAKAQGRAVKVGKAIMSANGKSLIEDLDRGFIKLVFDAETEVLLGGQLMCGRATDLINELTTAIVNGLTATQLAAVIRPHPTFGEAVTEAVEALHGRAIHIAPRR